MITTEMVLILGAGASIPYGLPSGEQLVYDIRHILRKTTPKIGRRDTNLVRKAVEEAFGSSRNLTLARDRIQRFQDPFERAMPRSVDRFLYDHPELWETGKVLIAAALLARENPGQMRLAANPGGADYEKWYRRFVDFLQAPYERFHENQVSVLTFNYDRSLEYFLFEALRDSQGHPGSDWWTKIQGNRSRPSQDTPVSLLPVSCCRVGRPGQLSGRRSVLAETANAT